jgi:hypothetical protein
MIVVRGLRKASVIGLVIFVVVAIASSSDVLAEASKGSGSTSKPKPLIDPVKTEPAPPGGVPIPYPNMSRQQSPSAKSLRRHRAAKKRDEIAPLH